MSNLLGLPLVRSLNDAVRSSQRSMERLATGRRINRASDDPAGLIASQNLGKQSAAIRGEIQRLERESLVLGAREGATSVVSDLMIELDSLVVQAANKGATTLEEREALQLQADAIIDAVRFTCETSTFNGEKLFGNANPDDLASIQVAAKEGEEHDGSGLIRVNLSALRTGGRLNLIDGNLEQAQELTTLSARSLATSVGGMGAQQKTFYQPQINQLTRELEGVEQARSQIRDTDFAKETGELVRSQVLAAAATKVIEIFRASAAKSILGLLGAA
ncbi:MAG: flagellin [Phycisphaerales bacterium]